MIIFGTLVSVWMWVSLVALVILQGIVSYKEKTCTTRQIQLEHGTDGLSFWRHGGTYGDLIILPIVSGIAYSYLIDHINNSYDIGSERMFNIALLSMAITVVMHIIWAKTQTLPGHIIANNKITMAGLIHLGFMWLTLTLILMFYFGIPMADVIDAKIISVLLAIFLPIGIIQPGYAMNKRFDVSAVLLTLILEIAIVWWNLSNYIWS